MKLPAALCAPLSATLDPFQTIALLRQAVEVDTRQHRQAGTPKETVQALIYMAGALKKVEQGASLADAFNLAVEQPRP